MPDEMNLTNRSTSEADTLTFSFYMADLLRVEETAPEPDLRQDLVIGKLGLVVRTARRIARRYPGVDLALSDLIQEGNLALLQAVNEWLDCPPEAAHFHTFIARRIEKAIRQCADAAWRERARSCSLEGCWDELCKVEAPTELEPAECVIHREGQQIMIAMLGSLDRRLRTVAALRCGFCDGRQRTFEEIGREIGVSDARAGQLMASAKRVLRHPIRSRKLRDFYCD